MRFNRHRGAAAERHAFDHVRVKRALRQEFWRAAPVLRDFFRLGIECLDEQPSDCLALDLGVFDALQRAEEKLMRLDVMQRNIIVVAKQRHHFRSLALAQQAVIDEDASERVADRLMNQHGRDGAVDAAR